MKYALHTDIITSHETGQVFLTLQLDREGEKPMRFECVVLPEFGVDNALLLEICNAFAEEVASDRVNQCIEEMAEMDDG